MERIKNIPIEIEREIYSYISNDIMMCSSKHFYLKYHSSVVKKILKNKRIEYDTYIRNIVRNDYYFIFENVVKENFNKWTNNYTNNNPNKNNIFKKYIYKTNIYKNYTDFLLDFCTENESTKCRNLIAIRLKSKEEKIRKREKQN